MISPGHPCSTSDHAFGVDDAPYAVPFPVSCSQCGSVQPNATGSFLPSTEDWHLGTNLRVFVQLKSGLEDARAGGSRPIDEKRLDFESAFLEVGNTDKKNWAVLRIGRQELNYGSGRLVSVREGPNVRQSFDGVKIRGKAGAWNVDAWAVRPDLDRLGFFDNAPDHTTAFWGVYATRPVVSQRWRGVGYDLYYLGLDRKNATFERGTATELRHTVGARLWRPIATEEPGADFDYEGVVQFGTFGSDDIRAWTFASDTGYSVTTVPLRPRFSIKADISSGDNPGRHTLLADTRSEHSIRSTPSGTISAS